MNDSHKHVCLYAVPDLPLVTCGDDVGTMIFDAASRDGFDFRSDDVIVVAQKIVSKAEGAVAKLADVVPSLEAIALSDQTGRDARLCQVYLNESEEIIRVKGRMVITRHRLGFECSGAGVDRSNIASLQDEIVVLLPLDPDASARAIQARIQELSGSSIAVIVTDSFGRPDRDGSVGIGIGIAGISHLEVRTQYDLYGNPANSRIALVDELSAAASILMGQADESLPVVIVRGVAYTRDTEASIRHILV